MIIPEKPRKFVKNMKISPENLPARLAGSTRVAGVSKIFNHRFFFPNTLLAMPNIINRPTT